MAMKVQGGRMVHAPTPSNQNPGLKKAEDRMIRIASDLTAVYSDLNGVKGAEGVRARIADMENAIQNLRGTLFNLSHGR